MSLWARAKHTVQLDWRAEWREIEAGTRGEEPGTMIELVDQMNEAYKRKDSAGYLALKDQLVRHPSWIGSKPILNDNPVAGSAKPTEGATQQAFPI